MAETVAVRVVIRGRVQGVWFRAWTENVARDLCLDGWVRNRSDGSVEAVFAGPAAPIDRMIINCREGPPAAAVESVEEEWIDAEPLIGTGFRKKPTA
ncbi:MAG: acylphosphatase [Rhodospirillaceae bacterium]|mgnify:FL=1|jgi:acylphosphatase|nr:acylphosphatase [Rhodospirillaceae bacterium]MBT3808432.1 acylphosphatase [Rhodospirillaceae bacterium]MBT3930053.1 acylphosphatase [Rhodospirillaceae bacterium]MBT4771891.1 acylphosphatase [Rhodospirillaceae bacterium]MBT5358480.1 acylphosphatase [Rhodospirillaceae bacterium]